MKGSIGIGDLYMAAIRIGALDMMPDFAVYPKGNRHELVDELAALGCQVRPSRAMPADQVMIFTKHKSMPVLLVNIGTPTPEPPTPSKEPTR